MNLPRWLLALAILASAPALTAQAPAARYVRHGEVQPLLRELLTTGALANPAVLSQPEREWDLSVASRDVAIRSRLLQGDEDTLINWLLLGTTFTSAPRIEILDAPPGQQASAADRGTVTARRIEDFIDALRAPAQDERRLFARQYFEGNGFELVTARGVAELRSHLAAAVQRVTAELTVSAQELASAGRTGQPLDAFVALSQLFSDRGLSLDTAIGPNYALDQSFEALRDRGLLTPATLKRVAIIGAGLDFADKLTGFDFYPPQMIQPFAVVDSLLRHRLAQRSSLPDVVLFDISPRIFDHVRRVQQRSADGQAYRLSLAMPNGPAWLPEFRDYWKEVGGQVGTAVTTPATGAAGPLADVRAVDVSAGIIERLSVVDLNIVTQRLEQGGFDLIIATNVLLYYDRVDQSIALANIASMLRDGGLLLSNTLLPEVDAIPMRLVGARQTQYSKEAGDNIVWYQRQPERGR